jgi:fatty acid desaturase
MTDTLERIPEVLEVLKGAREKILVRPWESNGYRYVSLAVQTLNEAGGYVFMKGRSFALKPSEAAELAAALVTIAAMVEASPVDPAPTAEDRELSRMP